MVIRLFKTICLICMVYALGACSSAPSVQQLPIQSTENLLFKVEQQSPKSEASLLAIQFTPHQWRWVQTDPLGAPIARLILEKNGWKNDGFVMPNQQAQHLYSALATALNPTQPLFDFSGIEQTTSGQIYQINGKEVWRILQQKNQFQITLADGSRWHIELLE